MVEEKAERVGKGRGVGSEGNPWRMTSPTEMRLRQGGPEAPQEGKEMREVERRRDGTVQEGQEGRVVQLAKEKEEEEDQAKEEVVVLEKERDKD